MLKWLRVFQRVAIAAIVSCLLSSGVVRAGFEVGLARQDATPNGPVRLSGYGNRDKPSEGVDVPLHARAMALRHDGGPISLLVSIDSIGFSAGFVQQLQQQIERKHGVTRARLAVCSTHSHTSPHPASGLDNLFATPLTDEERQAAEQYTEQLSQACLAAVNAAITDLKPARLQLVQGTATFAVNRRVLKNGVWTGFGITADGPVDHRLPVLVIREPQGDKLRGVIFNYACHCTTFGGDYNRVNGDWAGYAAEYLEAAQPGIVALCTIGCGADQNPERDSQRALEIAQIQGREIADETVRLLRDGTRLDISAAPVASFGYAGLAIDRPSVDDLKKKLEDKSPQVRRHAEHMLAVHARMGRLPESYPMPIQVWRFGDELAMVFLGGEVCVDYEYRIRRELEPQLSQAAPLATDVPSRVFVTAYANDVFGYVAPERMQSEGGYEVDFSMIYYMQPGRWSSGTEDGILRRVHELFEQPGGGEALSVSEALKSFTLPKGLEIDVVAAEPLVRDPINMAIDARGRLWVVEMGDYPRGAPDDDGWSPGRSAEGKPWDGPAGGRIRTLTDDDGDGRYDSGVTFLEGLTFPTGVAPWRDGVVVSCAPDILFARDTDGDGVCDEREVLYTGFVEENPQHRVNGFEYGLDGWLYLASGAPNREVTCIKTGEKVDISGRDLRIHPDTHRLEAVSGRSQYGRCRDAFGNWFGNTNSEPLFQFVIEDRQLRRNPFVAAPSPRPMLSGSGRSTPVFPTSRTVDRFNDMYAANRFTSACGPQVLRDPALGQEAAESVFFCEPVHNLVSRLHIQPTGPQFTAARVPAEGAAEFLSSSDPWFRPVRMTTGPDGGLWLCDMYRLVIEHPQWIPEAWQARINLSAGADRGRIYRVRPADRSPSSPPNLEALNTAALVQQLTSTNGWHRDTAQRLLIERGDQAAIDGLRQLVTGNEASACRLQALWTLAILQPSVRDDIPLQREILSSDHPELVIQGLRIFGLHSHAQLQSVWTDLRTHSDPRVRYELALVAGDGTDLALRSSILRDLAVHDLDQAWIRTAVLSSAVGVALELLRDVLVKAPPSRERESLVEGLIGTALGEQPEVGAVDVLAAIAPRENEAVEEWQVAALGVCLEGLSRRKQSLETLSGSSGDRQQQVLTRIAPIFAAARDAVSAEATAEPVRTASIRLLGRQVTERESDLRQLTALLGPQQTPQVQSAAIERLAALQAAEPLLASLTRLGPAQQAAIEAALLQHTSLTHKLLASLRTGEVTGPRLSAATRAGLTSHRDAAIRELAIKLLGKTAVATADVSVRLSRVAALTGDTAQGRIVFEKRCAACHRHNGLGNEVGPQLGALQNKTTEFLLTQVLDANRSVEPKYRSCTILLVDGRQQTGLVSEETATSLTLVTADGRKQPVLRRDIEELVLTGLSFMPEGIDKDLSDQNLADVIRFVQTTE